MALLTVTNPFFAGDDALKSQYDIVINDSAGILKTPAGARAATILGESFDVITGLQMRALSMTIPDTEIATYEASYKSLKITKVGGQITTPNEFSFNFRVDKYWIVYSSLDQWLTAIADPISGVISTAKRIDSITVKILDLAGKETFPGWRFEGCVINKLGGVSFEQGGSDPVEAEATFQYLRKVPLEIQSDPAITTERTFSADYETFLGTLG